MSVFLVPKSCVLISRKKGEVWRRGDDVAQNGSERKVANVAELHVGKVRGVVKAFLELLHTKRSTNWEHPSRDSKAGQIVAFINFLVRF